ncbi:hypothetical protein [Bombilactobacillus bombi]|uniref:hypothetical protein n=1 Tax=Bombilactobacillus bombi TaxID=1303590 RepID=UPI0015E5F535|nr:hypothetical protein [Bombilactobacillus bombi]MBA1435290.1 hypothetical protein [Bombilactobacillus bombi]
MSNQAIAFWAIKAPDRTAQSLKQVFASFMQHFGNGYRCKEFAQYQSLKQRYGLIAYFSSFEVFRSCLD